MLTAAYDRVKTDRMMEICIGGESVRLGSDAFSTRKIFFLFHVFAPPFMKYCPTHLTPILKSRTMVQDPSLIKTFLPTFGGLKI